MTHEEVFMPVPAVTERSQPVFAGVHPADLPVGAAPGSEDRLPFVMEQQEQTEWCWAAVAASVSRHHDPSSTWTQCLIADAEFGVNICCDDGSCRACNRSHPVGSGLRRTGNLDRFLNRAVDFDEVKAEVAARKPVCVRIAWQPRGGHAAVIAGYVEAGGARYVIIHDPLHGESTCEFEEFLTGYRLVGRCTSACLTKRA
jgi:hypothetical protein